MKNTIVVSIPKPCSEKWDNFIPTSRGAFCSGCQKEVIDFTAWNEQRIQSFFKANRTRTCGKFRREQLVTQDVKSSPAFHWLITWILTFHLSFISQDASSLPKRSGPSFSFIRQHPNKLEAPPINGDTSRLITGVVVDQNDQLPMPGVNVIVEGSAIGTVTDADGKFSLQIPAPTPNTSILFSFIGYETQARSLSATNISRIEMAFDRATLGEVVVVGEVCASPWWSPRRLWFRIRNLF